MEKEWYFNWLCQIIDMPLPDGTENGMVREHEVLLGRLFELPYYWSIDRDANRAADGMSLRREYFSDKTVGYYKDMGDDVSVLEVLVALARRIESDIMGEGNNENGRWFWEMIDNLGMEDFYDDNPDWNEDDIYLIVTEWLEREFHHNGYGSPFPLEHPEFDQRDRELWFQMSDYLVERYDF